MKIGLGLPNADKSVTKGRLLVDIARRAEALGFSSLATIGRVAYPNYEELVTLAAAAGATERIGLGTDILLAATREPVQLAKQAASLDQISGGRFVLGIGTGARPDDFAVTGTDFKTRGRRLDAALELMHSAWRGEPVPGTSHPVTPRPVNGRAVPLIFGGGADAVVRRVVKYGIGYTQGGGTPESLKPMMDRVNGAWTAAGRGGKPEFRALGVFRLRRREPPRGGVEPARLLRRVGTARLAGRDQDGRRSERAHQGVRGDRLRRADPFHNRAGGRAGRAAG